MALLYVDKRTFDYMYTILKTPDRLVIEQEERRFDYTGGDIKTSSMPLLFNASPTTNRTNNRLFGIFDITKGYLDKNNLNGNELKNVGMDRALEFDKKKGILPDISDTTGNATSNTTNTVNNETVSDSNEDENKELMGQSTPIKATQQDELDELILNSTLLKKKFDDLQIHNDELTGEVKRLNWMLLNKNLEINTVNKIIEDLKECKSLQIATDTNQNKIYSNLITEIDLKFEKLIVKEDEINKLNEHIINLNELDSNNKLEKCLLVEKLSNYEQKLNDNELNLKELNLQINDKNLYINNLNISVSEYDGIIKSLNDRVDKSDNLINNLTVTIEESKKTTVELESQVNESEYTIKDLNSHVIESDAVIKTLTNSVNESENIIKSLKTHINESDNMIKNFEANLDDSNRNIEVLKDKLSENERIILELNDTIQSLTISNNDLNIQICSLKENSQISEDKIFTLNENIILKESTITELNNELITQITFTDSKDKKYQELSEDFETLDADTKKLKKDNEELHQKLDRVSKYMQNLTLFDQPLSSMIKAFEINPQNQILDVFFRESNKKIISFKTTDDEKINNSLKNELKNSKEERESLTNDIENNWKHKLNQSLASEKKLNENVTSLKDELLQKLEKLQRIESSLDNIKSENLNLIKEKEITLQNSILLNKNISDLKNKSLDDNELKFKDIIENLNNSTKIIDNLKIELSNSDEQNSSIKKKITEKDKIYQELKSNHDKQAIALKTVTTTLKKIEGNRSQRITFDIANRSRPDMDKQTYELLMVDKVDAIDLTQLQNLVKNLILLLEIPFSKLTKKLPLIGIYLKYERPILIHFSNQIHYQLYNEEIDTRYFTNKVYSEYIESYDLNGLKHPLESCLDTLYKRISSKI